MIGEEPCSERLRRAGVAELGLRPQLSFFSTDLMLSSSDCLAWHQLSKTSAPSAHRDESPHEVSVQALSPGYLKVTSEKVSATNTQGLKISQPRLCPWTPSLTLSLPFLYSANHPIPSFSGHSSAPDERVQSDGDASRI